MLYKGGMGRVRKERNGGYREGRKVMERGQGRRLIKKRNNGEVRQKGEL